MPYLHHTQEFIDKTIEVWINLINRYNPDTNKKYTQKQVIYYINEKYGEVSIKTIREWIVGKGVNRGQGIGQERGNYSKMKDYNQIFDKADECECCDKQIAEECACGCKGKSCVSCGAHVQQRDQYVLVERKHIHCLWCYKDKKKKGSCDRGVAIDNNECTNCRDPTCDEVYKFSRGAEDKICECCGEFNDIGLATGENGIEMLVCKYCDIDGSNYNGWGDETEYMNELIECFKCEKDVKRKNMAWRMGGGYYLDVCKKCDEDEDEDNFECEECGELFRLGTFNTFDEEDGTQFCFCDGCRDKMINNNIIVATDEETIYERVLLKCEQCDCDNKEKLAEYWWVENSGKKWTLCEDCGIAEEQEKC